MTTLRIRLATADDAAARLASLAYPLPEKELGEHAIRFARRV